MRILNLNLRRSMLTSIALGFALSSPALAQQKVLKITAATTAMDNIFEKIQKPFEQETGIKLEFTDAKGAHSYYKLVVEGKVEAAVTAFSYGDWVKQVLENKGEAPADMTHRVVGRDKMNIISHKGNGITKLRMAQVADIFTGKVKNFKEVGGADVPIQVVIFADSRGKNATFRKLAMNDAPYAPAMEVKGEDIDVMKAVVAKPGAISFRSSTAPLADMQVVETDSVIGRPITLINRGAPKEDLNKLINFIRTSGPKYGVD